MRKIKTHKKKKMNSDLGSFVLRPMFPMIHFLFDRWTIHERRLIVNFSFNEGCIFFFFLYAILVFMKFLVTFQVGWCTKRTTAFLTLVRIGMQAMMCFPIVFIRKFLITNTTMKSCDYIWIIPIFKRIGCGRIGGCGVFTGRRFFHLINNSQRKNAIKMDK